MQRVERRRRQVGREAESSKNAPTASAKPAERLLFLEEPLRERARLLACRIYKFYMAGTENKPHGHVGRLRAIAERVDVACEQQLNGQQEWSAALAAALAESRRYCRANNRSHCKSCSRAASFRRCCTA